MSHPEIYIQFRWTFYCFEWMWLLSSLNSIDPLHSHTHLFSNCYKYIIISHIKSVYSFHLFPPLSFLLPFLDSFPSFLFCYPFFSCPLSFLSFLKNQFLFYSLLYKGIEFTVGFIKITYKTISNKEEDMNWYISLRCPLKLWIQI